MDLLYHTPGARLNGNVIRTSRAGSVLIATMREKALVSPRSLAFHT
jgi:hypothetical protein